jgi:hypothetical protein
MGIPTNFCFKTKCTASNGDVTEGSSWTKANSEGEARSIIKSRHEAGTEGCWDSTANRPNLLEIGDRILCPGDPTPPGGLTIESYFYLVAKHSGKCLDVAWTEDRNSFPIIPHPGIENEANVIQSTWVGSDNQQWSFEPVGRGYVKIIVKRSGKCLDVYGAGMDDGANVQLYDYLGGDNQKWKLVYLQDGHFKIIAKHSGKCLDVSGMGMDDGANVFQWDWWGGDNQKWRLVPLDLR